MDNAEAVINNTLISAMPELYKVGNPITSTFGRSSNEWYITGPGLYYVAPSLTEARSIVAMLNGAYALGYADNMVMQNNNVVNIIK